MEKQAVEKAVKELRQCKKKFSQSYDLIFNLKGIDLKKTENQVDFFVVLPHSKGKAKICALVGPELKAEAEAVCDFVIEEKDFDKYAKDKKLTKKLASEHAYFIAQANIMPKVAAAFGKVFGPRKKMPNPKAGCIVPPKANLKPLYEKLQKTIVIIAKEKPIIQLTVGNESMKDEEVTANIMLIYDQLIHHLPDEKNNLGKVFVKLTMSKPVRLM